MTGLLDLANYVPRSEGERAFIEVLSKTGPNKMSQMFQLPHQCHGRKLTPIHWAIFFNSPELVDKLASLSCVSLKVATKGGADAFGYCLAENHPACFGALLLYERNLPAHLIDAVLTNENPEFLRILLERHPGIPFTNAALAQRAQKSGNDKIAIVDDFIQQHPDPLRPAIELNRRVKSRMPQPEKPPEASVGRPEANPTPENPKEKKPKSKVGAPQPEARPKQEEPKPQLKAEQPATVWPDYFGDSDDDPGTDDDFGYGDDEWDESDPDSYYLWSHLYGKAARSTDSEDPVDFGDSDDFSSAADSDGEEGYGAYFDDLSCAADSDGEEGYGGDFDDGYGELDDGAGSDDYDTFVHSLDEDEVYYEAEGLLEGGGGADNRKEPVDLSHADNLGQRDDTDRLDGDKADYEASDVSDVGDLVLGRDRDRANPDSGRGEDPHVDKPGYRGDPGAGERGGSGAPEGAFEARVDQTDDDALDHQTYLPGDGSDEEGHLVD
jgi:hypothetical protein